MNVLITGGCGFLGSNVASRFLQDGARLTIIDKMHKTGARENLRWLQDSKKQERELEFHELDVASIDRMADIFQKRGPFDYVCHLAGQVAMTTSLADPLEDFRTNALGTVHVLECARKWSPKALVAFSSTNKVYGDLRHLEYSQNETRYLLPEYPNGIDESMPLDFASPYGCSKGSADQYVRDWYRNFGLDTVVFRHSSIYGGRQYATADQGWIGWFAKQAIEQDSCKRRGAEVVPFTISGTGKQVRDVLHSEDLISLYQAAYEKRSLCAGEVFNIGGGMSNSLSLIELFDQLSHLLGRSDGLSYLRLPRRQSDQDFFVADITKAHKLLGWSPRVSASQGLTQMIDWVGSL
jgi:CDP-paratose 2-epimerase